MNRQIEFRGRCIDNGEWVYGYYVENKLGNHFIYEIERNGEFVWNTYEVDTSTVGQFTGLVDRNEKKIYEGDVVNSIDSDISGNVYGVDEIVLEDMTDFSLMASLNYSNELEVIGNIF